MFLMAVQVCFDRFMIKDRVVFELWICVCFRGYFAVLILEKLNTGLA